MPEAPGPGTPTPVPAPPAAEAKAPSGAEESAGTPTPVPEPPSAAGEAAPPPLPATPAEGAELDADLDSLLEPAPSSASGRTDDTEVRLDLGAPAESEEAGAPLQVAEEDPGEGRDEAQLQVVEEDPDEAQLQVVEEGPDEGQDEAQLQVVDEDQDEAFELEVGEADEDELLVEAGELDEDEWAAIAEAEAAEAEAAPAPGAPDRGALAARRSVRSRKPRDEVFPMVGGGAEALRLRKRLLANLAERREGGVRARLLVSAAELAEQLGEGDEARALYRGALETDPTDVVALRSLRRDAVLRGAWDELAALFAQEAALDLGAVERALAFTGLAEVSLARLDDPEAAAKAAQQALEIQPSSVAATVLLAEARWRLDRPDEAVAPFAAAREVWDDPDARAMLAVEEARRAERRGDREAARTLFRWANEVDPEALDGWFGRARTESRADADPRGAVEALATIAAHCGGPLGEAVLSRASRVATRMASDPTLGVRLLGGATGVVPLQARADAASATSDRALELEALAAWANAAGGTDRALALVRMAEVKAAMDDLDGAEGALRDAALADGSLGTIRVVREVIARRAGDVSRLVDAVDSGGALAAAARVATDPESLERERELLAEATAEATALVSADVLGLDVAAARGDEETIDTAIRRQADRVPPEQRTGSLIALVERAIDREDLDGAETLLGEARQLQPGDPLVLRPLGRLALRRDPTEAAALWMEESSVGEGPRAAHAATQAGRILASAGKDALGAFRRALDEVPGYGPAAWALKPLALEMGDPLTLGEVHEQLAEASASGADHAGHLVRGALLRAEADPDGAAALLERARAHAPDDAVLQSLLMRLPSATSAADRAAMLQASAQSAPEALARVFRLRAASALEDAGDPTAAAAVYRALAESHPDDAVTRFACDRAELDADEVARVAERRFAAVKNATDDDAKVHALERLAELDLHERKDPASAVLSLQSILEMRPGHLPSLRALQRYFAEHDRVEDAARVTRGIAEHVEEGPDVTAHVRLARRLLMKDPETPGEVADDLLTTTAPRAELDLWLAPRVLAAALARGDDEGARLAARALASLLASPEERASARVRAAELLAAVDAEAGLDLLREALSASPHHPTAAEALAEACEEAAALEEAAEAYETAGRGCEVRQRAAALFYRAGDLWTRLEAPERARAAFELASEADVTHADLFDRLHGLLEAADDKARLADLYQRRLAAGGDTPEMVELYVKQATLRADIADLAGAKAALRSALALSPERLDALRSLANLCLEDEDWRGAAEVLIRIARIRKEREELRWVFFTLGDIYDRHMPDPRRAEAAFKRVLKLLPEDLPAMERLAQLYEREGQLPNAAAQLQQLAQLEVDAEANRRHRLKLAEIHEQLGDARKAEQVLEEARKNAPTDLAVLRALADFYQRQEASNALAMHLSRAVNDFRHALEADLGDAAAWPGLVELLTWRGKSDAAAAAASAAQALGVVDVEISKLVDARGAAPGAGGGAASDQLDDLLAPPQLSAPARAVFRLAGEALEKSLPFDVAAYRAEKLGGRDTTLRPLANEVGRWFGIAAPELYVTSAAPRVCVPVYSNPVTLLIGSELLGITDDREKLFVLVRALKIAKAQLSVVVRAQPQEVLALMGGLVQSYDPHHTPAGVDPAHLAEAARRVSKHVPRKVRDDLGPLVFEMAGRPGYDAARLAMAASEWGNRTALVASGSAPAAVSALAKLSGERELPTDPPSRLAMVQRFPEAASLLAFAVSDAHFEARHRAGVGRG
ncbi:MAG TPA: hypothetical protein RMH99_10995 [Sandaracinaceae bacterium LLY-WYZ-13_1]|nr:hypothetical protein [Sandaracinaceae bacterium LLY-WYZ-13_1]